MTTSIHNDINKIILMEHDLFNTPSNMIQKNRYTLIPDYTIRFPTMISTETFSNDEAEHYTYFAIGDNGAEANLPKIFNQKDGDLTFICRLGFGNVLNGLVVDETPISDYITDGDVKHIIGFSDLDITRHEFLDTTISFENLIGAYFDTSPDGFFICNTSSSSFITNILAQTYTTYTLKIIISNDDIRFYIGIDNDEIELVSTLPNDINANIYLTGSYYKYQPNENTIPETEHRKETTVDLCRVYQSLHIHRNLTFPRKEIEWQCGDNPVIDQYHSLVVSLMHFDDLTDEIPYNSWTLHNASGNASIVPSSHSCASSFYADINSDAILINSNLTGFDISNPLMDFTIEFFAKLDNTIPQTLCALTSYINSNYNDTTSFEITIDENSIKLISVNSSEITECIANTAYTIKDHWHHYAFTRENGIYTIWIDGISRGNAILSNPQYVTGATLRLFNFANGYGRGMKGYMDEFEFINGAAKYTENFTPINKQLPYGDI